MDHRTVRWISDACDRLGIGVLQGRRPLDPTNAMPFGYPDGTRVLFMPVDLHVVVLAEMKRSVPWHFEFEVLRDAPTDAADAIRAKRLADLLA